MRRGVIAEIDLNAITHNLGIVKRVTENRPVIAVVKADAYGHGAVEISKRLLDGGVSFLAVAFIDEAVKLREAGIRSPILVLFDKCDITYFFEYHLTPVIHDLQTARRLSEEARKRDCSLDVHVKVDTGMGRLGFHNQDTMEEIIAISKMHSLNVRGLMSHFSESDIADKSYAETQLKRFHTVKDVLVKKIDGNLLCHMANSAATLSLKDAHFDAVRPGLMLYGYSPIQQSAVGRNSELIPVMKVKTKILALRRFSEGSPVSYGRTFIARRESVIAVLPIGYADGYSRLFSNNMDVIVRGRRVHVVGRVCMDLTMVDVTDVEGVKEGDEVVLLGRQGDEEITVLEMAAKAATIPYEILTTIGNRSRRVYV